MAQEKKEVPPPMTLKYFIDDHQKILAVVGVFMALSIFFANSTKLRDISIFISFLCFAASIPLLLQVYFNFTQVKSTWLLFIFINIFTPLTFYVFWFLLMAYRPIWKTQTANVLLWVFIFSSWYLLKHFKVQTRFAKKIEQLMMWQQNRITERNIIKHRQKIENLIKDLPDEHKNQKRVEVAAFEKQFREKFAETDLQTAIRDSRIAANALLGIGLFMVFVFVSNRVAGIVNPRLDKMYESYIQTEAASTPTVTTTPTATPDPSPTPSASPTTAPTPFLTETRTPSKRRKR